MVCADFLVGSGANQITIRMATSERVVSHSPLAAQTAIACGPGAELLWGGREVKALYLPNLEPAASIGDRQPVAFARSRRARSFQLHRREDARQDIRAMLVT